MQVTDNTPIIGIERHTLTGGWSAQPINAAAVGAGLLIDDDTDLGALQSRYVDAAPGVLFSFTR